MTASAALNGAGLEALVQGAYDVALGLVSLVEGIEAIGTYAGASAVLLVSEGEVCASAGTSGDEVRRVERAARHGGPYEACYHIDEHVSQTGVSFCLLQRFPAGARTRELAPVLPHIARALKLRHQADHGAALAADLSSALAQQMSVGIIALRPDRSVVSRNAAASELLERNRVLDLAGGRLVCRDRSAARRLAAAIAADEWPVSALAEDPASGDVLALLLRRAQPGRWLLFAHDPARPPRMRTEYLAERYGLTPKEARLALGIAYAGNITSLAKSFGVSVGTLRSQLKSVFQKSGTESQPQLILKLLSDPILLFERDWQGGGA